MSGWANATLAGPMLYLAGPMLPWLGQCCVWLDQSYMGWPHAISGWANATMTGPMLYLAGPIPHLAEPMLHQLGQCHI